MYVCIEEEGCGSWDVLGIFYKDDTTLAVKSERRNYSSRCFIIKAPCRDSITGFPSHKNQDKMLETFHDILTEKLYRFIEYKIEILYFLFKSCHRISLAMHLKE